MSAGNASTISLSSILFSRSLIHAAIKPRICSSLSVSSDPITFAALNLLCRMEIKSGHVYSSEAPSLNLPPFVSEDSYLLHTVNSKVLRIIKYRSGKKRFLSSYALDQRLHVVQVSLERLSSGLREAIVRPRNPTVERLSYLDVTSFLQPPSVNTEVPVGGVETLLEFVEGERFLHHECAYDPKADTPVDNPVERGRIGLLGLYIDAHGQSLDRGLAAGPRSLSHRASSQ